MSGHAQTEQIDSAALAFFQNTNTLLRARFQLGRRGDSLQRQPRPRKIALLDRDGAEIQEREGISGFSRESLFKIPLRRLEVSFAQFQPAEIDQHPGGISAIRDRAFEKGALVLPIGAAAASTAAEENNPSR